MKDCEIIGQKNGNEMLEKLEMELDDERKKHFETLEDLQMKM